MNLLKETVEVVNDIGKTANDIVFIGSAKGYSCTWNEYCTLADKDYDAGYGGQEVATDLIIIFKDNSWLERAEYDGSEWWEYKACPSIPQETKTISKLFFGLWSNLGETS